METVPTAAAKHPDSRPAALRAAGRATNTTITVRDYRVGVVYAAALWGGPLDGLDAALERPEFTLYPGASRARLGSSCPSPRRGARSGLRLVRAVLPPFVTVEGIRLVASDERIAPGDEESSRHDVATDRAKWHFAARKVYMHRPVWREGRGMNLYLSRLTIARKPWVDAIRF